MLKQFSLFRQLQHHMSVVGQHQRKLDSYAEHVMVCWTRSDSASVITFLPQQPHSHVNMAWDQGNVIPSTLKPPLALWNGTNSFE